MSHESKRLKKSSSDWLNAGNALITTTTSQPFYALFPGPLLDFMVQGKINRGRHNALMQRVKNAIFVFPILPGNAEAQVN